MATLKSAFPPPPDDLTKYIIQSQCQYSEAGAFGDVFKCVYNSGSLGRKQVAVKAFRFKFPVDANKMVRRELGIWRRLDHPNIVPFLGITTGFGRAGSKSLVSLWMGNGTLESFLRKYENLEVDHRLRLLLDIANGLHYLHSYALPGRTPSSSISNPILHGDLNSANVLLDDDYTARLVDFGYASMMGDIPDALFYLKRSSRRSGALRWNAPEQVWSTSQGVHRTTESDVYSFGCIALQVLSGRQPWSEVGEDVAVILRLSKGETPGRPDSRPIYDRHWELVERCLSPIPNRPTTATIVPSIAQFLEDFPHSQPLRDVIATLPCLDQQSDTRESSYYSTSTAISGDTATGVAVPDDHEHVFNGSSSPHQRTSNGFGFGQPLPGISESATGSEGCFPATAPLKGLPSPWVFRVPHQ